MKFSEDGGADIHHIDAYAPGRIVVDGRAYRVGLAISPSRILEAWGPVEPSDLAAQHIAALLDLDPEMIIVGTGARQVFPHPTILAAAYGRGVGVEIMDTGAACRTYNILAGEGRRVAAGLLLY
jgi:uncharacterized protein